MRRKNWKKGCGSEVAPMDDVMTEPVATIEWRQ